MLDNAEHLKLWPSETPGDIGIDGSEYARSFQDEKLNPKPTKLITNVTEPSITVMHPSSNLSGMAVMLCPGGGYHDLFWEKEGEMGAAWLLEQGITAIILKYRCPRRPGEELGIPARGPLIDAQRAIRVIRNHAVEWNINPNKIGIIGFSAGGHLALSAAFEFAKPRYPDIDSADNLSCRPDFIAAVYSGYLLKKDQYEIAEEFKVVPKDLPPIFLTHASDDEYSGVAHSLSMCQHLREQGHHVELHVWSSGNHNFAFNKNSGLPSRWMDLCLSWLDAHSFLEAK
ncbi:MAG: alpha/beta hydrolase [Planctomycetes bacterium]|nr:alpha/beta hydrolase [Planctomycetota bacterium]